MNIINHLVQYFTLRCLGLNTCLTVFSKYYPKLLPAWLYQASCSLVMICSVFGSYILYSRVDIFSEIFGSAMVVYLLDFLVHILPLLYILFYAKTNTSCINCTSLSKYPTSFIKYISVQIAWFMLYLYHHSPCKVYHLCIHLVFNLVFVSLLVTTTLWRYYWIK